MERKQKKHSIRELHVREDARRRYALDGPLYSLSGGVILADLNAARTLASQMNRNRDLAAHPGQAVRVGDLNAAGLIDEIMHHVVQLYRDSSTAMSTAPRPWATPLIRLPGPSGKPTFASA